MQRFRSELLPLLLLLLFPLLLFAPVSVGNQTLLPIDALYLSEPYKSAATAMEAGIPDNPLLADLILENYGWQRFLVRAVEQGELPLWDPFIFSGHPFLANGQHSGLYPLQWLFHLIPIPRAYGVFIVLQLGLAGIWMYLLGRLIGAKKTGAFLAGITFQLSGFLIVSVVHPMIVAAASWLPLLLALIELTLRRAPFFKGRTMLPWALLGAMALGLSMLAGHAELTYFTLLVMAGFSVWRIIYKFLTLPRELWKTEIISPALGIALMITLGLSLGAVQYFPLYEIVSQSFRQGSAPLQQVLEWAYPKRRIITFLVPNFFGNPTHRTLRDIFTGQIIPATVNAEGNAISSFDWGIKNYVEGGAYLGILPLLLAAIAILKPPFLKQPKAKGFLKKWLLHPYVPFFTALALFSLGCIFGTPLYAIVYALPLFNQSHSPFRWVFPLTVSIAALVALGTESIAAYRKEHGPDNGSTVTKQKKGMLRILLLGTAPNIISITGALAFWSGSLLLAGLWASRLAFDSVAPTVERIFWSMAKAQGAFPDYKAFYSYEFQWIQQAALLLISAGVVLRVSRCPIYLPNRLGRRPIWEALAVLIILVDLITFGTGFNPQVNPALLDYTPPAVEFLRQDQSIWRFTTFDPEGHNIFNMNTGMFYDFQDIRGYDSLFTAQYARYMGWIEPQGGLPYNRIAAFRKFPSLDSPLTDLLNVKYVMTDVEIPLPKYKQVYQDEAVRIYENLGAMPRAFSLPQTATLVVQDGDAVGEAILSYDPRHFAIIEAEKEGWIFPQGTKAADTLTEQNTTTPVTAEPQAQQVSNYGRNEVTIEANVDTASWVILGDAFFPGWKAFVKPVGTEAEEQEVAVARIAGNFRGVQVEPGSWTVRFKYSPNSVKYGAFLSFLAGMVMLFLGILWVWRRVYHEEDEQSMVQRVGKNSLAPIALTLFNRAIDFAFAALMLRILGPANAGDYYYAINIFGWFEILSNFGLDAYLTREVARHRDQGNRYLFNTTAVRLGLSAIGLPLLAGFIALRQTLVAAPASNQAIIAIGLLYIGLVPGSISKGLTSLFYAYEKAEYPAAITTFSTLLKVTLGTIALLAGWGIIGLAGASVLINLATLVILSIIALRLFFRPQWAPERTLQREMMGESWPLMLNHLLASLFFKVDIVLMDAIKGNVVVGLYSTGYKFLDALNVIPSMFTFAIFPVISRQAKEDPEAFRRVYQLGVKILVSLALPAAMVATLAAHEMVFVLGGQEYLPDSMIALQLMVWSMPIGWINSLTNYVLVALDQQHYLTRAFIIGFLFNLITNLLFMPTYSYRASAIIHIFSELALLIPFAIGLHRHLGKLNWWSMVGKPVIAAATAGTIAVILLPLGRGWALLGALLVYPLALWKINILSPEEQTMLAPLLPRHSPQPKMEEA